MLPERFAHNDSFYFAFSSVDIYYFIELTSVLKLREWTKPGQISNYVKVTKEKISSDDNDLTLHIT